MRLYLLMMAPVTPHIAEELWQKLGYGYSVHQQAWPEVDEEACVEDKITLVVQINGKLRDRIMLSPGFSDEQARATALSSPVIQEALEGKTIRKVIVVPGKLVNVVI